MFKDKKKKWRREKKVPYPNNNNNSPSDEPENSGGLIATYSEGRKIDNSWLLRHSDVFRRGASAPCGKFLGAVNFGEHFNIIWNLGHLGDKKKKFHSDNLEREIPKYVSVRR